MRVNRLERMSSLYNSLHKRPYYKEEEDAKKKKDEEEQYKEFKEKLEDFQSHLESFKEEIKSNPCDKEGVDMEAISELFKRNE